MDIMNRASTTVPNRVKIGENGKKKKKVEESWKNLQLLENSEFKCIEKECVTEFKSFSSHLSTQPLAEFSLILLFFSCQLVSNSFRLQPTSSSVHRVVQTKILE